MASYKTFLNLTYRVNLTLRQLLIGLSAAATPAWAGLDLDRDGMCDIWAGVHGIAVPAEDPDGDGFDNLAESIAGTDPHDAASMLALTLENAGEQNWMIHHTAVGGKSYLVQRWNALTGDWEDFQELGVATSSGAETVALLNAPESGGIFRLKVTDVDADRDGVSLYQEILLGLDDSMLSSEPEGIVGDFETAVRLVEQGGSPIELTDGSSLPAILPTADAASRFLVQSTFGPDLASISDVQTLGYSGWIDSQLAEPETLTRIAMGRTRIPFSAGSWSHGWWWNALLAQDALRQRMAYALSQIFVVSFEGGTVVGDNSLTQANYYDGMVREGFSNYRDVLEHVTYSPVMGFYLSHLNNRKGNVAEQRFPDENFAREIMQLFSIGLFELNEDGSHQLDGEGNSIPTYDNEVITEMARVFTGMSNSTSDGRQATSFYDFARGNDFRNPMVVWDEEHDLDEKTIIGGQILPAGQTGEQDVQQTLDALSQHPNTAPFISRLLIQRFTSSNPSPDYMRRVVHRWNASDGDLGQVLTAILLDPEARNAPEESDVHRGKVREPIIRMLQVMRAFHPNDHTGSIGVLASGLIDDLGQYAMRAPSVFNFYSPNNIPAELFGADALFSPELALMTGSRALSVHNRFRTTAFSGHWVVPVEYDEELALIDDFPALVDHLDTLLLYGEMSDALRAEVLFHLDRIGSNRTSIGLAVYLIMSSPEYAVLR